MKAVVIGSGGREHALALKISKSPSCGEVFCIPGNPGTATFARNIAINPDIFLDVANFCKTESVDLVVIGPEKYLCDGMADFIMSEGIPVFGPSASASRIESDKAFSKSLMVKMGIPTAVFKVYKKNEKLVALTYCDFVGYPVVIKAAGLAAGKGVVIAQNREEAEITFSQMFEERIFGDSGDVVVVEEFLKGEEASVFAICDGNNFILLPAAQDHKRIGDGDTGKNTGGMGAYAPAPLIKTNHLDIIAKKIVKPVLEGLNSENSKFVGCLFCGLMINGADVKVVEFNARFGDPETQAIMGLIEGDFLRLLYSAATGAVDSAAIEINNNASVCVVLASKGYPDKFDKGYEINGLEAISEPVYVYHSGTIIKDEKLLTNGGRVLGVTSVSPSGNLQQAIDLAYSELNKIEFDNIYYRKDIGAKGLKR